MKIALAQFAPKWEAIQENLDYLNTFLKDISGCDIIVLPEMFTTGFTMNPSKVAESHQGRSFLWMQKLAEEKNCAVTGSLVIEENSKYYNRLYFVKPDGSSQYFDKRHLFTLAGEEKQYSAGKDRMIVEYKGWKICPLICYDLRFPVYSRIVKEDYDILIYVASWPGKRIFAWDHLLIARAIENMSYVIGVNRTGIDENELIYPGHSVALDYMGMPMHEKMIDEKIEIVKLNKEALKKARQKLAFINDSDHFKLFK